MAKKYCASFPCSNLAVDGAYCAEHRPPRAPKETNPFYLTPQWRRFRDHYIKCHALCEQCMIDGRPDTPARMVDHVIPIEDGGAKTSDDNAMSMCWKCHGLKTAKNKTEKMNENHQLSGKYNRAGKATDTY